jgi:hypothetical protein
MTPPDGGATADGLTSGYPNALAGDRQSEIKRYYYSCDISGLLDTDEMSILGNLAAANSFTLESTQRDAWLEEIRILKGALSEFRGAGSVYFEYSIPRLGGRIDVIAIISHVIFILEFKVGEREFTAASLDQVWDYALDLKHFHETSHVPPIAPILIATEADDPDMTHAAPRCGDNLFAPIKSNKNALAELLREIVNRTPGEKIDPSQWGNGRYYPTPTIIEAATSLYSGHSVSEISRNDATAINLSRTSAAISEIIESSKARSRKAICFVTGVPGAGKTLVGLNIATKHFDSNSELYSVFLSGNGPLVDILREALARDKVRQAKEIGERLKKSDAMRMVEAFIQNVHHFREDCLAESTRPPIEHVALFDEAQRAWNLDQTAKFMLKKKGRAHFALSEPEFLISCLDRHPDWAVVVCLVGGGQEINTGEAGISEWLESIRRSFPAWHIYISRRLTDSEYAAAGSLQRIDEFPNRVSFKDELHLGVSMRSFRAEDVSLLVKQVLDLDAIQARQTLGRIVDRYPIAITRDLPKAKDWLKQQARGSERFGIVASSEAQRLKPLAIDVKSPIDPVHWFLNGKQDVRSSFFLEDVATEFQVQGLELDWTCVVWDADFRRTAAGWGYFAFSGDRWKRIGKPVRETYLKNAYRVLLTRARQGMVIVVPEGDSSDPTRQPAFYDSTFDFLAGIGFDVL